MSTLQIRKLESGTFKHIDSIDGSFFLGKFSFKQELNKAFLVEAYGAKRREYSIAEISVYNFGGAEELFTNWDDLFNRLTDLGYTGIETNGIIPVGDYLSNQITDYTNATLPLTGTENLILNDGTGWKKLTWTNIKAQLKTYFDTLYQSTLVSGTNIKTINGTSVLGSGDLVVSGGGVSKKEIRMQNSVWSPTALNTWKSWTRNTSSMLSSDATSNLGTGTTLTVGSFADCNYLLVQNVTKLTKVSFSVRETTPNQTMQLCIKSFNVVNGTLRGAESNFQELVNETFTFPSNSSAQPFKNNWNINTHTLNADTGIFIAFRMTSGTTFNAMQGVNLILEFE